MPPNGHNMYSPFAQVRRLLARECGAPRDRMGRRVRFSRARRAAERVGRHGAPVRAGRHWEFANPNARAGAPAGLPEPTAGMHACMSICIPVCGYVHMPNTQAHVIRIQFMVVVYAQTYAYAFPVWAASLFGHYAQVLHRVVVRAAVRAAGFCIRVGRIEN